MSILVRVVSNDFRNKTRGEYSKMLHSIKQFLENKSTDASEKDLLCNEIYRIKTLGSSLEIEITFVENLINLARQYQEKIQRFVFENVDESDQDISRQPEFSKIPNAFQRAVFNKQQQPKLKQKIRRVFDSKYINLNRLEKNDADFSSHKLTGFQKLILQENSQRNLFNASITSVIRHQLNPYHTASV